MGNSWRRMDKDDARAYGRTPRKASRFDDSLEEGKRTRVRGGYRQTLRNMNPNELLEEAPYWDAENEDYV